VLAGLVLNITAGWWWADPAFAIVLALAAGREAIESFRERTQDSRIEDTAP
jgi:divalent metal cation (Fe/Co/Zn/Cd) transporter